MKTHNEQKRSNMQLKDMNQVENALGLNLYLKYDEFLAQWGYHTVEVYWYNANGQEMTENDVIRATLKEFLIEEHNRTYKVGEKPAKTKAQIRDILRKGVFNVDKKNN